MAEFLKPENCNKAKCKTCMFQFNENAVKLSQERMDEIVGYLSRFESSHVCHTTGKTCRGGLELQANLLHKMGVIPEPDVDTMIKIANETLHGK